MECKLITCGECKELGNEICPYENVDRHYGNIYEVIYSNKRVIFLLIKAGKRYYLIDATDRMHHCIGPFANIEDTEKFLKENAVIIDKNKTDIATINFSDKTKPRKCDIYKRNFIKEEPDDIID